VADLIASAPVVQAAGGRRSRSRRVTCAPYAFHAFRPGGHGPGAGAGVGRRSAVVRQAGNRRRRPAARGGSPRSTSTSAPTSTITRHGGPVAGGGADQPAGGEQAAPRNCSAKYHAIYPGFPHDLRRRSAGGSSARIFPPRDSESPPIGGSRRYFVNAGPDPGQLAVSDVILGRLSYVPIITIAMPVVRRRGARWPASVGADSLDPLEVRHLRRGLSARCPTPGSPSSISISRVIFTSGQTSFTALPEPGARPRSCSPSAEARTGVLPLRARRWVDANQSTRLAATAGPWAPDRLGRCSSSSRWSTSACSRPATTPSRLGLMLLAFGGAVLGGAPQLRPTA